MLIKYVLDAFECNNYIFSYVGDLDTENTSDMDKPLLMYKDLDKPLVMDIAEYRNHASKRSGELKRVFMHF